MIEQPQAPSSIPVEGMCEMCAGTHEMLLNANNGQVTPAHGRCTYWADERNGRVCACWKEDDLGALGVEPDRKLGFG